MWTTSRYALISTRKMAKQFAELFNHDYYARGKHTIEKLAAEARKNGEDRIFIIEEKNKQNELCIIAIDELGQWQRLSKIVISNEN